MKSNIVIKNILSIILVFFIVCLYVGTTASAADAVTELSGSGTSGDPFLIGSAAELKFMRDQVNAGGTISGVDAGSAFYNFSGERATISLGYWQDSDGDSIVEDGEIYDSASEGTAYTSSNWTPIGTAAHPFSGTFYGKGNTISGIYLTSDSDCQGLFGKLSGGVIDHLNLTNSYIKGENYVGGMAGYCSNTYLTGCNTMASVSVNGNSFVGGVAGYFSGKNEHYNSSAYCVYNNGKVSGNECVGGLIGYYDGGSDGKIISASNSGSITGDGIVGGLIGQMWNGTLSTLSADEAGTSIYNSGTVSGESDIGGLIGQMVAGAVSGCYNTGTVSGGDGYSGGIVGTLEGGGVLTKCYNTGALTSEGGGGGIAGMSNGYIKGCYNEGGVSVSGTEGCFAGGVAGLVNTGETSSIEYLYCCYNTGNVSGSGGVSVGGVAGCLQKGNAGARYCYNIGNVTGESYVGGVAGKVGISDPNISYVADSYNYGCVSGSSYVGGVAGYLSAGGIHDCYNYGSVSGVSNVGAIAGDSAGSHDFLNYYDKQSCPTGGVNGSDIVNQAEGKLTSELTASGFYKFPDIDTAYSTATTNAAYVGISPINLYASGSAYETASAVKTNFTVSTVNGVSWTSGGTGIVSIDAAGNATIKGSGSVTLTATKGSASKKVKLNVKSNAKAITAFTVGGVAGTIDETNHTIAVALPYGTDVTSLSPTIAVSDNATVSPASGTAKNFTNQVTYTVTADNSTTQDYIVTVTVAASGGKTLQSITTPTAITGLTNGTAKTAAALLLPSTVTLVAGGDSVTASVTWAVYSCPYDASLTTAQTFTVSGTVILPSGVVNTNNVSLSTSISVTVSAATVTDKVLQSITAPTAITGVVNGTAKTAVALGLPSTVTLVTDQGSVSASVYWAVNSALYNVSTTTEQTFPVDGTVTLPSGVVNTSSVALTTSISVTVNAAAPVSIAVTGVSLNKSTLTLTVGGSASFLTATVSPTNATNQSVTWQSSNTSVAIVSGGVVTPVAAGTATITVTTVDGSKTAVCAVTVTEPVTAASGGTTTITDTPVTISVPSNVSNTNIDVTPGNVLPLIEINAATSLGTVQATIPAGTTASGPAGWSGEITLPTVKASPSTTVTGAQTVNAVVEIGLGNDTITFSKAVRLVIPGMAGKSAGYVRNGVFTPITRIISADNQTTADAEIPATGDGKIDVGNDLVIWTKHFTEFIAYTPVTSSSSGGGGGGSSTSQYISSTTGSASVTPSAGGKVGLNSDAAVEIPANAIKGSTALTVKVQKIETPAAIPSGFKIGSDVYDFTVDGKASYSFDKAVTITLKFNPADFPAGETPTVYYYDETSAKWVEVGGTVFGSNISVSVDHFTKYIVMAEKKAETQPQTQPSAVKNNTGFTDLDNHWAKAVIEKLAGLGAVSGYPDGSFKPDAPITRAEYITMLVKAMNLTASGNGQTFKDCDGHWASANISITAASGIVNGYGDNCFKPDNLITREEMAVIAVKAAKLEAASGETSFNDNGQISSWAKESVLAAVNANIIKGCPDNTFRPQGNATRAEAASVILRLVK